MRLIQNKNKIKRNYYKYFFIIILILGTTMKINSDEGMWTLDNLPLQYLNETYKFKPQKAFLKNIQLSSVRFNDGGSGSFVSKNGLVLTNHHVAMGQLQKISNKKNDYVNTGFLAKSKKEEIKCPDLELNILISFENVSERVNSFIVNMTDLKEIEKKRKEVISNIEKESYDKSGLRSDVVELYHGGEFWLYKYKRYTDIRLVHSPELQLASFGGDSDNFQYPRYALDYAFFRVYENDKPIEVKNYLKWSSKGFKENELLFVSGHPGSTDRQKTVSEILFLRDHSFPEYLKILNEKIAFMKEYSSRGKEEERRARGSILGMENSIKAIKGEHNALLDNNIIKKIEQNENLLKDFVNNNSHLHIKYNNIWNNIKNVKDKMIERKKETYYQKFSGQLPSIALTIIQYDMELDKPNSERFEEFRDSSLETMRLHFLTSAPVYKDKDIFTLSKGLMISKKELGDENLFIKIALENKEIDELAKYVIENTKLDNIEFRKELLENRDKIKSSKDPLILWVKKIEPILRKNREWVEKEVESILTTEGGKLSELRFLAYGRNTYPDATFTLRLSIGSAKGYEMDGWKVPSFTTFNGLLERSQGFSENKDYKLSPQLVENKNKLNLSAKINFCSTHDITGGNSGSPVINAKGEIVGLIFDGNAYSHSLSYVYTDDKARSISVHTEGIEESLRNIYKANKLLAELNE